MEDPEEKEQKQAPKSPIKTESLNNSTLRRKKSIEQDLSLVEIGSVVSKLSEKPSLNNETPQTYTNTKIIDFNNITEENQVILNILNYCNSKKDRERLHGFHKLSEFFNIEKDFDLPPFELFDMIIQVHIKHMSEDKRDIC